MTKIHGVILAGGAGRRLGGADKAVLEVGGVSLLDRARGALAPAGALAVAGGARLAGRDAGGLPLLEDLAADKGPLAGLAAGLAWAEADGADWLLSTPVDAPFLEPKAFEALLAAADDDVEVVVAEAGDRIHWLIAAWRPRLAAPARQALDGADLSVAHFVKSRLWRAQTAPGDGDMFLNINRPADLSAAEARVQREGN